MILMKGGCSGRKTIGNFYGRMEIVENRWKIDNYLCLGGSYEYNLDKKCSSV